MDAKEKKFGAKQIAYTAVLLAICLISQVFKNLSIFITGPIINTCLVMALLTVNLPCAIVLCIITPITSFLITGAPIMSAVPAIIPLIMAGNAVLVVSSWILLKKDMIRAGRGAGGVISYLKALVCAALKGVFMWLTISKWLLPGFLPQQSPLFQKLPVLQTTFSLHQFITACIGFVYVFVIWAAIGKGFQTEA